jgi:hypothetical protein
MNLAALLLKSDLGPAGFPVSPSYFDTLNPRFTVAGQGKFMSYKNLKLVYLGTSIAFNLLAMGRMVLMLLQGK